MTGPVRVRARFWARLFAVVFGTTVSMFVGAIAAMLWSNWYAMVGFGFAVAGWAAAGGLLAPLVIAESDKTGHDDQQGQQQEGAVAA